MDESGKLRVVIAEDNYLVREGLVRLLEELDDVQLVAATADLESLSAAVDELLPDVVLTDIRMPPSSTDEGIRLARQLRSTHPDIGVVVLSQFVEPLYALALFEGGSERRAYLLKDGLRDPDELARALREVAAGRALLDPRVVDALLTGWRARSTSPLETLSARELETLALVAQGCSNAAIAERLALTKRAVERCINAIFAKLELKDAADVSRRVKAALVYLSYGDT